MPNVLREIGSVVDTENRIVVPAIGADWSEVFYQIFRKLAHKTSKADRAFTRQVHDEVRRLSRDIK